MLVINQFGENLGSMPLRQAVEMAKEAGLDLMQLGFSKANGTTTTKILDVGKYRYNLSLKQKEEARKQRENEIKMKTVQIRIGTAENDLKVKAKQVSQFTENAIVKLVVKFKNAREMGHTEFTNQALENFLSMCPFAIMQGKISVGQKEISAVLIKKEVK